uniref:Uncharacterized protein n=1 Tax=Kryptolebias marmoratus TaxID=37003 RepID=A0A3Q2ZIQ5_KRYMA
KQPSAGPSCPTGPSCVPNRVARPPAGPWHPPAGNHEKSGAELEVSKEEGRREENETNSSF